MRRDVEMIVVGKIGMGVAAAELTKARVASRL